MKKIVFLSFVLFAMSFKLFALHAVLVSGAGTTGANGLYKETGYDGSRPAYAFGSYTIAFDGAVWNLKDAANAILYMNPGTDAVCPTSGWAPVSGLPPFPTLVTKTLTDVLDVSGSDNNDLNGSYLETGYSNNRFSYKYGSTGEIYFNGTLWGIYLQGYDITNYYSNSTDFFCPLSNWEVNTSNQSGPAPTLVRSLYLSPKAVTMVKEISSKTLSIKTAFDWTVSGLPAWLSIDQTSGTGDATLTLSTTEENNTPATRSADITFTANGISKTINVRQIFSSAFTQSIASGGLDAAIPDTDKPIVLSLSLTGTMDARDFKTIFDKFTSLQTLDISGVTIEEYTGTEGPLSETTTYPANTIPQNAFSFDDGYGDNPFNSLTTISLPENLIGIGNHAFASCTGLTAITLPANITTIGNNAFNGCTSINNALVIPAKVTAIGDWAFRWAGITSLVFNGTNLSIGEYAFTDCTKLEGALTLPAGSSFGGSAFSNCSNITSVIVNAGSLGRYVFYNCSNLSLVSFQSGIAHIPSGAFASCSSLTSIHIPNSVTSIEDNVFGFCPLTSFTVDWNTPLEPNEYIFDNFNNFSVCTFYVPYGTKALYQAHAKWGQFTNIVEATDGFHVNNENISFTATGGTNTSVKVTGNNVSWTATSNQPWASVSPASGTTETLSITAGVNNGKPRTALITLKASGFPDRTIKVSQEFGSLNTGELPALTLGTSRDATAPVVDYYTVKMAVTGTEGFFRFKPTFTGTYKFSASGLSNEGEVFIYDGAGNQIQYEISEGKKKKSYFSDCFELGADLTAGETYYLGIGSVSNITVTLSISGGGLTNFIFSGTGNWSSAPNWNWEAVPTVYNSATINGAATTDADVSISNLVVSAGNSLTIGSGKTFKYNDLTLKSGTTGTATFISDISGIEANVEQYFTGNTNTGTGNANGRFWYTAIPVSQTFSSVFDAVGTSKLWYYTENTHSYSEITDNNALLTSGTGYVARLANTQTVTFTGTLNSGNITLNPTFANDAAPKQGYNLIGNPYTAYLNWENVAKTNVSNTIWRRTFSGSAMVFETWDGLLGTNISGQGEVDQYIAPMQAFWVKATASGAQLDIPASARSTRSGKLLKSKEDYSILRLQLANATQVDEAILAFGDEIRPASAKMSNESADVPEIYTLSSEKEQVINYYAKPQASSQIALGFRTGKANTFTIKASEIRNFANGASIILEDKLTGKKQDLRLNPEYQFTSEIATTSSRFVLHFAEATTGINELENENISINQGINNQILVKLNSQSDKKAQLTVYTALGQKVLTHEFAGDEYQFTANFPAGVYLISVVANGKQTTIKIPVAD
jgi:hypothetical protein